MSISVGDKVRIRDGASSMLAGRVGTVLDIKHGGTNRFVSREPHYKLEFGPSDSEAVSGMWFDADEVEAAASSSKETPDA